MRAPRIDIDVEKLAHNAKALTALYAAKGIDVVGVTKVVCGDPVIAAALVRAGISILADSRTANIERMRDAGVRAKFLLLRTPMASQAEAVVRCADISLNSEISVIRKLSAFAVKHDTTHQVILMTELGDLREGLMPADLESTVREVVELARIELVGIGTNLACLGGIAPTQENMGKLSSMADDLEARLGLRLEFVSGGNSANFSWVMSTKAVGRINSLRLGESIFLGRETLQRKPIPGLCLDAFKLVAEVIESKVNPSLPWGQVHQDAFGRVPELRDQGPIQRVILGVGQQDVLPSGLTPKLDIQILGATSDHIIINAKGERLEVGDEVEFDLDYSALLPAMTSPYVSKRYC
jgi:predicted amino acid racemase